MRKKLTWFFLTLAMVCMSAGPLFAGGIINKSNQSADYLRTLNRHAATDYADIAVYNPAGIMKFDDGFKLKADVMHFNRENSSTVPPIAVWYLPSSGGHYEASSSEIFSGLFAVYKQDRWGCYFARTALAGDGELSYKIEDSFFIEDIFFKAEEPSVFGYTLGGAYKINDTFAVSLGLRYADGDRNIGGEGSLTNVANPQDVTFKLEQEADGWAGIVGLNITPSDTLNLGLT